MLCLMFTDLLCPCMSSRLVLCQIIVLLCLIIVLIIHYLIHLMLFIYLMTAAAHEEIATGGQIRGVGESNQHTLSKCHVNV